MKSYKTYLWLMAVNLFISTFTFGGGYVVVPMVRRYFVNRKHFFSEADLMNMAAVAQSTPVQLPSIYRLWPGIRSPVSAALR